MSEVVDAVADAIWPLENLSSDEARDELRRDVIRALAVLIELAQGGESFVSGSDLEVRIGALVLGAVA